jgi:hypothetical protein
MMGAPLLIRRDVGAVRVLRTVLLGLAAAVTAYLAVLAVHPSIRDGAPAWLRWFGRPASWQTMAVIAVVIVALCVISYRSASKSGSGSVSLTVLLALTVMNCVLGLASYWNCHDGAHPMVITPLMYTAQLIKGGTGQLQLTGGVTCPAPDPVALDVARLSSLGVIFVGVASVVVALFHSQVDRMLARTARSVTAVVGVDDDSRSMVTAAAETLEPNSELVLVTESPDQPSAAESRREGARVLAADLDTPEAVEALPLWHKLDRLYLLAADAATNLMRLDAIGERRSALGVGRRVPLIVRIDDPWHAAAWRAEQLGGTDTRWAADAVGKYELTARRLVDEITAAGGVTRVLVCGTSPLTLALCADLEQRRREHDFCANGANSALPAITLVGETAQEYRYDHLLRQQRLGLRTGDAETIIAVDEPPSMAVLKRFFGTNEVANTGSTAVIFVDADPMHGARIDPTLGTRLAMRFPDLVIFAWNPSAGRTRSPHSSLGQLRTYGLTMDLPSGQARDAWERAAMLIHERYRTTVGGTSAARLPWADLDEFYRGSNRRQVRNALWIVEHIGGHTWNTLDSGATTATAPLLTDPLERLEAMGFDSSAALAMARAEHEDWCGYYKKAGWKHGKARDEKRKTHPNLTDWHVIESNPALLNAALTSLAETLGQLWQLGYRSAPAWRRYRRVGVVTAEQRSQPWTWTSYSGHEMEAGPGDWMVQDDGGRPWSVRDGIFHATHERVDDSHWRRTGLVLARPARPGERINTLEGVTTATAGGWLVQGEHGEKWPVSAEEFARRYEGPVT